MSPDDKKTNTDTGEDRLSFLRSRYGELLSLEDLAEFYCYPSIAAVRKAFQRNSLPVPLFRFPGKSGYLAKVVDVANSIDEMLFVRACSTKSGSNTQESVK